MFTNFFKNGDECETKIKSLIIDNLDPREYKFNEDLRWFWLEVVAWLIKLWMSKLFINPV